MTDRPITPRQTWLIMAGVMLGLLLASLDQTIVSTAMPRVVAELNGFDLYVWAGTAYLLTFTVTVPIYGKLSDIVGRKPVFLLGIVLFLIGSMLCGVAQTMTQLILFRGLQGLGAGALIPVASAIVGDLFSPRERGTWQVVIGSFWAIAGLAGPAVGGWITDHFSWRWTFYVNFPIGIVAIIVLVFAMPALRHGRLDADVDWLGGILLVAGAVPLLLAITWAGSVYPWSSVQVVGLLAGAGIVLALFMAWEWRHVDPIVELRLFTNRIVTVSVLVTMLIAPSMLGAVYFIPLFLQGVANTSATGSGAVLTPLILAALASGALAGPSLSRWGRYRYLAWLGVLLMLAGAALLLRLSAHSPPTATLLALLLIGAGYGCGPTLFMVVVQNAVAPSRLGQVTGALTFFRSVGSMLGLTLMGSFLTARYASTLTAVLPRMVVSHVPAATLIDLQQPQRLLKPHARAAMQQEFTRLGASGHHLFTAAIGAVVKALAEALHDTFIVVFLITLAAFVIVLFLPEAPLRGKQKASAHESVSEVLREESVV